MRLQCTQPEDFPGKLLYLPTSSVQGGLVPVAYSEGDIGFAISCKNDVMVAV